MVSLLAGYAGALVITGLISRVFKRLFLKTKISPLKTVFLSSGITLAITLTITYFTMGILRGIIWYVPCIMVWLIGDLTLFGKKRSVSENSTSI